MHYYVMVLKKLQGDFAFVTVMDDQGEILKRSKLQNHTDTLLSFFGQLEDEVTVAVEATCELSRKWKCLLLILLALIIAISFIKSYF